MVNNNAVNAVGINNAKTIVKEIHNDNDERRRRPTNGNWLVSKESNKVFSEQDRFEIYHRIENYPTVRRFLEKKARNNKTTPRIYHTGLCYFEKFLNSSNNTKSKSIQDLIVRLQQQQQSKKNNGNGQTNNHNEVYTTISSFVQFMLNDLKKSTATINSSLKAVKGLLHSEMITLDTRLVLESASVPRAYRDESNEYALDKPTVSKILQSVKVRRLRVFLFCLASSGCRVGELASIKWSDINLDNKPVSIHLKPEYTKTRTGRTVFVSDEAKEELNQWRLYKEQTYANVHKKLSNDELVFLAGRVRNNNNSNNNNNRGNDDTFVYLLEKKTTPDFIAQGIQFSFVELLENLGIGTKKQQYDKSSRHTITSHAFRKFFKTQVSLEAKEPDIAEYLIGHRSLSQTYFRVSPKQIQQIYLDKLMPLLTFCDSASLEERVTTLTQKTEMITDLQKQISDMEIKHQGVLKRLKSFEEGREDVDDLVTSYFQEKLIKSQDEKIKELEQREKIMMSQFDEFKKEIMERLKK